mmetsp:Transcript_38608/g.123748  ORF Transcript_38608/g.123748 Transcript_38608/m.123748 type:complete len:315 (+) Transcript_38608:134-1078(+)
MLTQTVIHVIIYSAGTFFANPLKIVVNATVGSSYAVAYAHFRRDHSVPLNVWLHALCTVIQVAGNFAFLKVLDDAFGTSLAVATAAMWTFFLALAPSPVSVKVGCGVLCVAGLGVRGVLAENLTLLALAQAPFEIACYWLIMPYHGVPRPGKKSTLTFMLALRVALWYALRPLRGALLPAVPGGQVTANVAAVAALAVGSLVRASDNMPLCEHLGLAAWAPAILLDQPWLFFLCLSFVGQALQGVAHEITDQPGTLPQLDDARHELAHCAYFPSLVLQAIHHAAFGPFPATVAALKDYPDKKSREAMGLTDLSK